MQKNLKVGIIVADVDEYRPLADFIEKGEFKPFKMLLQSGHSFLVAGKKNNAEVISAVCGIGKVNAVAAAMKLIDEGCSIILNYGLSGGISGVRRGDICVPERYLEHDFDLTGIGYKPCEKPAQDRYIYGCDKRIADIFRSIIPNIKGGTAVSGDHFVCNCDERSFLLETFGANLCDMETAAIAYVCYASGTPFAALRRISDDAGDDAAESYRDMNTDGDISLFKAVLDCIRIIADSEEF